MKDLNKAVNSLELKDIYKILYPTKAEPPFFKGTWNIFQGDRMLGHKHVSIDTFKMIEIMPSVF